MRIDLLHTVSVNNTQWVTDPNQAFESLSDRDKSSFLMEQAVLLGHLRIAYNGDPTKSYESYKDQIIKKLHLHKDKLRAGTYEMAKYLLGHSEVMPSMTTATELFDLPWTSKIVNPSPVISSFYKPFLHFTMVRYAEMNNHKDRLPDMYSSTSIPSFMAVENLVQVEFIDAGMYRHSNIAFSKESLNFRTSYLRYLASISTESNNVIGNMALLSNLVVDNDPNNLLTKNGNGLLYLKVKESCNNWRDNFNQIANAELANLPRLAFETFLLATSGLNCQDLKGIEKLTGIVLKKGEAQKVSAYLGLKDKTKASMDQYSAFESSVFGKLEGIGSISMEAEEESFDTGLDTPSEPSTSEPAPQPQESTEPSDSPNKDLESLDLGDKVGINIELSKGETFDSYLYRRELEQHIVSILNNPPKFLNNTKLMYLKELKNKWLNLLSIRCLSDMISRVVMLPIHIKLKEEA